jgi:hypothetical protein
VIAAASIEPPTLRLFDAPLAGIFPLDIGAANRFLLRIGHKLGACNRPFRQEAYGLELQGSLVAVAISASIVNGPVGGFERQEVVELARLGASEPWANRIMLRLWREVCAPKWDCWPVKAAVSYSHNATHRGDIYRFDGWERVRDDCGSSGGGSWSRPRYASDAVHGRKTLWLWRYE